jgi:hypothetical protein
MPDDELARLRTENTTLHHERETLIAMVHRASKEMPPTFRRDLIADLDGLLKESTLARRQ